MPKLRERVETLISSEKTSASTIISGGSISLGAAILAGGTAAQIATPIAAVIGLGPFTAGMSLLVGIPAVLLGPKAFRALIPKSREAAAKGENISVSNAAYPYWNCHMSWVTSLGVRGSGKTTLREMVRKKLNPFDIKSTGATEYFVTKLAGVPEKYAIWIDTRGMVDVSGDQWKASKGSNVLIFNFDHFDTREKGMYHTGVDEARLAQHEKLLEEILERIRRERKGDIEKIVILLTKKDLWMNGDGRARMVEWSESLRPKIVNRFSSYIPDPISIKPFSRDDNSDIEWLVQELWAVAK
jgi:hypothetical protein